MVKAFYKVPVQNVPRLRSAVEKLARQAARIRSKGYECVDPGIEVGETVREQDDREPLLEKFYAKVTVAGTQVGISGWRFAASLQHEKAGTIVRAVPGVLDDGRLLRYRDREPSCDHCGVRRSRVDTYLLVDAGGDVKQVGSSCLVDFLGHASAAQLAAYAELLAGVGMACEEAEGVGLGGELVCGIDVFLPYVVCSVRQHGWLSRTRAKESSPPAVSTSDRAWQWGVFPAKDTARYAPEILLRPSPEDHELARKVLEWSAATLEECGDKASDYEHNLRVVVRGGFITWRMAGLAASLVPYYERGVAAAAERALRGRSCYVGTVGKRQVFRLKVLKVVEFDTAYGTNHLHVMADEAGNRFRWSTSATRLEVGRTYDLRGTVKDHSEYKGVKQTSVTRCVEEVVRQASLAFCCLLFLFLAASCGVDRSGLRYVPARDGSVVEVSAEVRVDAGGREVAVSWDAGRAAPEVGGEEVGPEVGGEVAVGEDAGAAEVLDDVSRAVDFGTEVGPEARPEVRDDGPVVALDSGAEVGRDAGGVEVGRDLGREVGLEVRPDARPEVGQEARPCYVECFMGCNVGCDPAGGCFRCLTCTCGGASGNCHC